MDAVTLYAIATLANGAPGVIKHQIPADRCEPYARYSRVQHPTAMVWCDSELDPPSAFIGDHVPRENVVDYLPDAIDSLGMPPDRSPGKAGSREILR
jgi:hypothetical protein